MQSQFFFFCIVTNFNILKTLTLTLCILVYFGVSTIYLKTLRLLLKLLVHTYWVIWCFHYRSIHGLQDLYRSIMWFLCPDPCHIRGCIWVAVIISLTWCIRNLSPKPSRSWRCFVCFVLAKSRKHWHRYPPTPHPPANTSSAYLDDAVVAAFFWRDGPHRVINGPRLGDQRLHLLSDVRNFELPRQLYPAHHGAFYSEVQVQAMCTLRSD